jgi:uncharacterized protein (TIGR02594 family)
LVWFNSLRFAVRFGSRPWRFVRRQLSRSRHRPRRVRTTARGTTLAGITRIVTDSGTALMRLQQRFADTNASIGPQNSTSASLGSSNVVAEARRYLGGNPTGRSRLWCARFMNMVLERSGHKGTGSDMARSFASYGHRVSGPQIGAIAVMARRGGGHVGVVSGIDANGNPILVSGNNGHRVREAAYPRGRIYAYVMPTS